MAEEHELFFHEQIGLLASKDTESTIAQRTAYLYAIDGAILAKLYGFRKILARPLK